MAKIKVGDLVCMYRRKKKGMGIVLQHTTDLVELAGVGLTFEEFMGKMDEIDNDYHKRKMYKKSVKDRAKYPELINACMIYNASWAKKPKKEFVRIRWFERPSLYENRQIKEEEEWCPADWVRRV